MKLAQPRTTAPPKAHPLDLADHRRIRSTTVLCVRRNDQVVIAADGQVTLGSTVLKGSAKKIRRMYNDRVLAGFAGSTADAFSLFSRFEGKLEQYAGNLGRSAVELAKEWRTDKMLRHPRSPADRHRPSSRPSSSRATATSSTPTRASSPSAQAAAMPSPPPAP